MDLQILRLFLVSLSIAGFLLVWGIFTGNGGMEEISNAVGRGQYPNGEAGLKTFTGWRQLDDILMTQIGFNLIGLDHRFPAGRLFLGQFLANVSVPVFIITIEGIRGGVSALALSYVSLILAPASHISMLTWPMASQCSCLGSALPAGHERSCVSTLLPRPGRESWCIVD